MRLSRPARLLAAWIASFAMVFGALAPVLAQAGYRLSGERIWQELCTTEGVRYVLTEVESESTGGGSRASAPCQFCSLFASCLPAPASKRVLPLVVGAPSLRSVSSLCPGSICRGQPGVRALRPHKSEP